MDLNNTNYWITTWNVHTAKDAAWQEVLKQNKMLVILIKKRWQLCAPLQEGSTQHYHLRDDGKRLQKSIAHDKDSILAPIGAWIVKYKLNGLEAYKVALLRSKRKCKRQYYHCDTDAVSSLYQKDIKKCHLGVVCAP